MTPDVAESEVRRVVGGGAFARGQAYARSGHVLESVWDDATAVLHGRVRGANARPYVTTVHLAARADGTGWRVAETRCTCPVGSSCKHAAALLLSRAERPAAVARRVPPVVPAWQRALDDAFASPASADGLPLALQVELVATADPARPVRLRGRPVSRGSASPIGARRAPDPQARWVRTGISWDAVRRAYSYGHDPAHLAALGALLRGVEQPLPPWGGYRGSAQGGWAWLDEGVGSGLWAALDDMRRAGVALVLVGRDPAPLATPLEPASLRADLTRTGDGGLELAVEAELAGVRLEPGTFALLGTGEPTGLVAWAGDPSTGVADVVLARLEAPAPAGLAELARSGRRVSVPADESARFLHAYHPRLAARMPVGSSDGSVTPPDPPRTVLVLDVDAQPEHVVRLSWSWEYRDEDGAVVHALPPGAPNDGTVWRSPDDEARLRAAVGAVAGPLVDRTVARWETVDWVTDVLPRLRELAGVDVRVRGDLADYRRAVSEPSVRVTTAPSDERGPLAGRDWFDLEVAVEVDGHAVPLPHLIAALAVGDARLLLPDGLWLPIDTPALAALRALVEEARALTDRPSDGLRVSRFQTGAWAELEALGVVVEQAAAWRAAAEQLAALERAHDDVPVPASVRATLRPYQREGFGWLARLTDAGLGGVLADDMGLGKTLQVLTLVAHRRGRDPDAPPVLVVAPTSVVGTWAHEAATFVPHLRVVTLDRTRAKRGTALDDEVAGADLVVTTYALLRLDHDEYAAHDWSLLVLDEAQAVKNHEARTYACARTLPAPVKLAVTGTPLENSVLELWSLLGIVAPGLFPSRQRFTEFYRTPIERDGDAERLDLLRRRIRPLVLRRTKEQVAGDLPPRVETVVEVELAPRHRTVYDRQLQRERQKVLGLLGNLDQHRIEVFRSLTLLRRMAIDASLVDEAHAKVPASKLDALDDLLDEIVADGHRVLVFSQFTTVLDRVRARLDARAVRYSYLDGSTRRRADVVEGFRTGDDPVFLISLKAGGAGLTLTEADYVVVLDPWWNPAVEAQAVDRAHRIGQTRTVMVYRLVAKGTIEEKVMTLKAGKAALFDAVVGGGELASARLTADDVRMLLG